MARQRIIEDLRNIPNPKGRVDVMAYRLAERFTNHLQDKHGLVGIWDNIEPHVQDLVRKGFSGVEIPGEIKGLLNILVDNKDRLLAQPNQSSQPPK